MLIWAPVSSATLLYLTLRPPLTHTSTLVGRYQHSRMRPQQTRASIRIWNSEDSAWHPYCSGEALSEVRTLFTCLFNPILFPSAFPAGRSECVDFSALSTSYQRYIIFHRLEHCFSSLSPVQIRDTKQPGISSLLLMFTYSNPDLGGGQDAQSLGSKSKDSELNSLNKVEPSAATNPHFDEYSKFL